MKLLTRTTLEKGARALRRQDPRLGKWIDRIGPLALRRQRHHFSALCRTICSQQLGKRAAETIYGRFAELFAPGTRPSPERLLELSTRELRECGLSGRKVEYLRALAREFHEGRLGRMKFSLLEDRQIIDALVEVPGIGVWTAEMFLIFSVGRADVFSVGDLVLRKGVERVVGREMTHREIEEAAELWSPHRSVACLYLWKIADQGRD